MGQFLFQMLLDLLIVFKTSWLALANWKCGGSLLLVAIFLLVKRTVRSFIITLLFSLHLKNLKLQVDFRLSLRWALRWSASMRRERWITSICRRIVVQGRQFFLKWRSISQVFTGRIHGVLLPPWVPLTHWRWVRYHGLVSIGRDHVPLLLQLILIFWTTIALCLLNLLFLLILCFLRFLDRAQINCFILRQRATRCILVFTL